MTKRNKGHELGQTRKPAPLVLPADPNHAIYHTPQTRRFYEALRYDPVEVFPTLWGDELPVLLLVKVLRPPA